MALKATACVARHLLPVHSVYFTSSHWETCSAEAKGRTGSPVSRLFVPITMATLRKQCSGCCSRSQTIFPAAGSCMNSAVHVPPSPLSACAPLHRKADFSLPRSLCPGPGDSSLPGTHRTTSGSYGCAGSSMEKLGPFIRVPKSPKHQSQSLAGQILPWVETDTLIWLLQRATAKLAAGLHRGSARHLHPESFSDILKVLEHGKEVAVHHGISPGTKPKQLLSQLECCSHTAHPT